MFSYCNHNIFYILDKGKKAEDVLLTNSGKVQAQQQQTQAKPQAESSTEDRNQPLCKPSTVNSTVNTSVDVPDTKPEAEYSSYIWPDDSSSANAAASVYELAKPVLESRKGTDTIKSTSSITSSANKGCLEGVGPAVSYFS